MGRVNKSHHVRRVKVRHYTHEFKLGVAREYLLLGKSRKELALKYDVDPTSISHWIRIFGLRKADDSSENAIDMSKRIPKTDRELSLEQRLKDQERTISKLSKDLEMERLHVHALDTLIDVAEERLHVPIRKKSATKP